MSTRRNQGFTIIELIVVVVVIAILATITSTMYINTQVQARDLQIRDAADKVVDAIQLFISKNGHFPRGGSGSGSAIGSGTECTDGWNGFVASGVYACGVQDTLVASGYIPSTLISTLPKNTRYNPTSTNNLSIMAYNLSDATSNRAMIYYAQEDPSAADTTKFNSQLTKCGLSTDTNGPRDSWGMRGGVCILF